jgi:hypothetical protein
MHSAEEKEDGGDEVHRVRYNAETDIRGASCAAKRNQEACHPEMDELTE